MKWRVAGGEEFLVLIIRDRLLVEICFSEEDFVMFECLFTVIESFASRWKDVRWAVLNQTEICWSGGEVLWWPISGAMLVHQTESRHHAIQLLGNFSRDILVFARFDMGETIDDSSDKKTSEVRVVLRKFSEWNGTARCRTCFQEWDSHLTFNQQHVFLFLLESIEEVQRERKKIFFQQLVQWSIPSLNPSNSLKITARISQDPRHRGSCQDLFKIFAYVLVTLVYRIFQGPTRFCPGFQQVPAKNWKEIYKKDLVTVHSRSYPELGSNIT